MIPSIEVVIPAYRADRVLTKLIGRLEKQKVPVGKIHIMHTYDGTDLPDLSSCSIPIEIHPLKKEEFDHAGTRDQGFRCCHSDIVLFMTQDALPADDLLTAELAGAFADKNCAAAYARQIAGKEDEPIERFTRSFNYPAEDRIQTKEKLDELGIKTYFCSDVCAAYRSDIYEQLGGFEAPCIFNEDMIFGFRLIEAGYAIHYVSDAKVFHSHNYSGRQQFKRNFDLGVSQADHPEIFENISSESEGKKLVKQTMAYLARHGRYLRIIRLIYISGMKWLGYKTGRRYKSLPHFLIRHFTSNQNYWKS